MKYKHLLNEQFTGYISRPSSRGIIDITVKGKQDNKFCNANVVSQLYLLMNHVEQYDYIQYTDIEHTGISARVQFKKRSLFDL